MCESPYTLRWAHSKEHCPNLLNDEGTNSTPISVSWAQKFQRKWPSMVHLWSSWYGEYVHQFDHGAPRMIIRFEDLLFHTEKVMDEIRDCVGAEFLEGSFQYATAPAKTHPYFARFKAPTSLVSALIKYGKDDRKKRTETMTKQEIEFAKEYLDSGLMELFHYVHPTPS
jgi:hypothetical protein